MLCTFAGAQDCGKGLKEGWPSWARSGVYQGTLGKLPIVVNLSTIRVYDTRYAYLHKGIPIELEPLTDGKTLYLRESVRKTIGETVVTGCFALSEADTGLTGRWQQPDVKGAQAVKLARVDASKLPLNTTPSPELLRLRREDAFTFIRLNHPLILKGQKLTEPLSGLSYPLPVGASAPLKTALQDRLLGLAAGQLECRGLAPEAEGFFWYDVGVEYSFQSALLLSVIEGGEAFCGGAHPSLLFETFTLDRHTGQQVKLTDLWPKLDSTRLGQLYSKGLNAEQRGCHEAAEMFGEPDIQWLLTPKGLDLFSNSYPEVVRDCRTAAVTVHYSRLKAEARRDSPYYGDIYR